MHRQFCQSMMESYRSGSWNSNWCGYFSTSASMRLLASTSKIGASVPPSSVSPQIGMVDHQSRCAPQYLKRHCIRKGVNPHAPKPSRWSHTIESSLAQYEVNLIAKLGAGDDILALLMVSTHTKAPNTRSHLTSSGRTHVAKGFGWENQASGEEMLEVYL